MPKFAAQPRTRGLIHWWIAAVTFAFIAYGLHASRLAWTRYVSGQFTWAFLDFLWMAPLSYLTLFLGIGTVMGIMSMGIRPLGHRRAPLAAFAALTLFGVLSLFVFLHPLASVVLAVGLASKVTPRRDENSLSPPRWAIALAGLGMVLGAAGALEALSRSPRERLQLARLSSPKSEMPNVLLLILDTVRSANLSVYGYSQPTSPGLERIASEGTLFLEAFSTAPWTLPAHAGFFTGLLPGEVNADWKEPLDSRRETLAEVLGSRGFATAGFVANSFYTQRESGLARGFVHYEESRRTWQQVMYSNVFFQLRITRRAILTRDPLVFFRDLSVGSLRLEPMYESHRRTSRLIVDEFLAWQKTIPGTRPFFAFLNVFDAHVPYLNSDQRFSHFAKAVPGAMGRYNAAIASQDAEVGRLVDSLAARGLLDQTLLIVASDHGEMFGEHGLDQHGNSLFVPVLQVPLLMRYPPKIPAGERVRAAVSIRDVPATVLDFTGGKPDSWPGTPLAVHWQSELPVPPEPVVAEVSFRPNFDADAPVTKGDLRAVLHDGWHFIAGPLGKSALYAYRSDTAEAHNLAGLPVHRADESRLRSILDSTPSRLRTSGTSRASPEP